MLVEEIVEEMRQTFLENFVTPALASAYLSHDNLDVIVFEASIFASSVGFAIIFYDPDKRIAQIKKLHLQTRHANENNYSILLKEIDKKVKNLGAQEIAFAFHKQTGASSHPLIKTLPSLNWTPPVLKHHIFRVADKPNNSFFEQRWFNYKLSDNYSLKLWNELNDEDLQRLHELDLQLGDKPDYLSAFIDFDDLYAPSTLFLTYQGEIVGWIICRQIAENVILTYRLYLRPEYRKPGKAFILIGESLRRQCEINGVKLMFSVDETNQILLRCYRKRFQEYFSEPIKEEFHSTKKLAC